MKQNLQNKWGSLTDKNIRTGKRVLILLTFLILTGLFYNLTQKTVEWFRANTVLFKAPITVSFTKPVEVISLKELEVREANKELLAKISEDVTKQYLDPKELPKCTTSVEKINPTRFFETIRKYESSNGKDKNPVALHNYCSNKGKSNEIGYNPQGKFCFGSLEESKLYVAYYVKKNCEDLTMKQCLCYWNTGKISETCAYAEGNLTFAN